jgi:hypothetical protein
MYDETIEKHGETKMTVENGPQFHSWLLKRRDAENTTISKLVAPGNGQANLASG